VLKKLLATSDSVSLTVIRSTVGIVILAHGLQKLFGWFGGHGVSGTIEAFDRYFGFPAAVTILVILAESFGALSLVLGFLSRFCAAAIGLVMLGAIYFVTGRWGFFMNWYSEQRGEGFELHVLVLGMVLALILEGGGRWSVDRALWTWLSKRQDAGVSS